MKKYDHYDPEKLVRNIEELAQAGDMEGMEKTVEELCSEPGFWHLGREVRIRVQRAVRSGYKNAARKELRKACKFYEAGDFPSTFVLARHSLPYAEKSED